MYFWLRVGGVQPSFSHVRHRLVLDEWMYGRPSSKVLGASVCTSSTTFIFALVLGICLLPVHNFGLLN